jgi:gallate decarboxylase subunit D
MKKKSPKSVFKISAGSGNHKIAMTLVRADSGVVATILGGDRPHVGTVAIAIPRPSHKNPETISSTSSVMNLIGHKDEEIAKPISEKIAESLNLVAVVVAGVHIENADSNDIKSLLSNSMKCAEKAIAILRT